MNIRLDKYISDQLVGSRSQARKLIKQKRVFVNNKPIVVFAAKINPEIDKVECDKQLIEYQEFIYIALNKPKGLVSATKDFEHDTILDLLEEHRHRGLKIVGRLDKDTTGLILLTNDGKWLHKLKSPASNTEKEYEVTLEKDLTGDMLKILKGKMTLDGKKLKPIKITNIKNNTCNITLTEGKHHQIKRMFHNSNNEVKDLKCIRVAGYSIEKLNISEGQYLQIKK